MTQLPLAEVVEAAGVGVALEKKEHHFINEPTVHDFLKTAHRHSGAGAKFCQLG